MDVDRDLLARLEAEGWTTCEDDDGLSIWPIGGSRSGDTLINVNSLEVWEWVGEPKGDRSEGDYTCIAGPFKTLEAAQAAYLLLDEPNQKE